MELIVYEWNNVILTVETLKLEALLKFEFVHLIMNVDHFLYVAILASFPTDIGKVFDRILICLNFVFGIRCKCLVELTVRNLNSHALIFG